jgi:hypothetical protein
MSKEEIEEFMLNMSRRSQLTEDQVGMSRCERS